MTTPWTYLLFRYGDEVSSPTSEQIQKVAHELFNENIPGMTEGDYNEHGAASLRYGFDEGPKYVLEITRSGIARWEEWADQDYNEVLAPMREASSFTEKRAIDLWKALANGDIDFIRGIFATTA
jgi:hypothetical protein